MVEEVLGHVRACEFALHTGLLFELIIQHDNAGYLWPPEYEHTKESKHCRFVYKFTSFC